MVFKKGPLFYVCYNFRLFLFLLVKKNDIIVSNDLDTLPACYLISRIKKIRLVYDSHEYFTEVPELQGRKLVKKIWAFLERMILPNIKYAYTVCDSLADIYHQLYGTNFITIRNLPLKKHRTKLPALFQKIKNKKIILYQGSLNLGRGIDKVIKAMAYLDNTIFVIIGRGDIEVQLKKLTDEQHLGEKVIFTGIIPIKELHEFTQMAHLGITLEENMGKNYYFSLPNKLFDYIQARVPVLASAFPEMENIVKKYDIGITTLESDPEKLASIIQGMLFEEDIRKLWSINLEIAAAELNWENEQEKLLDFYKINGLLR